MRPAGHRIPPIIILWPARRTVPRWKSRSRAHRPGAGFMCGKGLGGSQPILVLRPRTWPQVIAGGLTGSERGVYGTKVEDFDVYIVHASEDESIAKRLKEGLEARGLRAWFNSFTPGLGVREQMEDGLVRSSFGVVVVTQMLFKKKWANDELNALMGLEERGSTRIIPVWVGLSAQEVRVNSPILATRAAVVMRSHEPAEINSSS